MSILTNITTPCPGIPEDVRPQIDQLFGLGKLIFGDMMIKAKSIADTLMAEDSLKDPKETVAKAMDKQPNH